jgi:hypothetical protein
MVPPSIPDPSMDIIASNIFVDKKGKKQQNMRISTRNRVAFTKAVEFETFPTMTNSCYLLLVSCLVLSSEWYFLLASSWPYKRNITLFCDGLELAG